MRLNLSKEDTQRLIKLLVRGGAEVTTNTLDKAIDITVKDAYKNRTYIATLQEEAGK